MHSRQVLHRPILLCLSIFGETWGDNLPSHGIDNVLNRHVVAFQYWLSTPNCVQLHRQLEGGCVGFRKELLYVQGEGPLSLAFGLPSVYDKRTIVRFPGLGRTFLCGCRMLLICICRILLLIILASFSSFSLCI